MKYFFSVIAPRNVIQIIKTCVQFVAHVVRYCNLLLSQVMHSKQFCRKWSTQTSTTPQTHVPGNCKWSNATHLLDPSLACEFSIPFYTMFNTSNLNLCTRKLTCMKTFVALFMRCKNPPVPCLVINVHMYGEGADVRALLPWNWGTRNPRSKV